MAGAEAMGKKVQNRNGDTLLGIEARPKPGRRSLSPVAGTVAAWEKKPPEAGLVCARARESSRCATVPDVRRPVGTRLSGLGWGCDSLSVSGLGGRKDGEGSGPIWTSCDRDII